LMPKPVPEAKDAADTESLDAESSDTDLPDAAPAELGILHQQPIPPPSEPMQYRAIGLVQGRYTPKDSEQLAQGTLLTPDGTPIDAVLLGRVISLVKNHLDLDQNHLWVVYPKNNPKKDQPQILHTQILGVWEPELLHKEQSEDDQVATATSVLSTPDSTTAQSDGYFSIRGEVIEFSEETQAIVVRIQQGPRRPTESGRAFNLNLRGNLSGRVVGYFWDLQVQRQGEHLVVLQGQSIGMVPPRKRTGRPKGSGERTGGFRRGGGDAKPFRKPSSAGAPNPGEGAAKPFKRSSNQPGMERPERPIRKSSPPA
jgi:hypothetical protein